MRRASGRLFAASVFALAVSAWVIAYTFDEIQPVDRSSFVAVSALCAATAGWLFASAISLQLKLRDKAFEFLNKSQSQESLQTAFLTLGRVFNHGENRRAFLCPEIVRDFYLDEASEGFLVNLNQVLNFFEEMAILVRRDAVDEIILRDFYCGMFCRVYPSWRSLAPFMRNIPPLPGHVFGKTQRPDMYENVDWLHDRWERHYQMSHFWGFPINTELPIQ